jgi:hypothetical protein
MRLYCTYFVKSCLPVLFIGCLLFPARAQVVQDAHTTACPPNHIFTPASIVFYQGACKNIFALYTPADICEPVKALPVLIPAKTERIPFIQVHGNVLYNFTYRSYIDTPFTQQDVMQHLVQTNLNFLIKGKYPLRMTLSNRSSNSPYFKNATDVNLQFNRSQLLDNIKADLRSKATALVHTDYLQKTEALYNSKLAEVQQLQSWLSSPARAQELVEEKERELHGNIPALPQMPDATAAATALKDKAGISSFAVPTITGLTDKLWRSAKNRSAAIADSAKQLATDSAKKLLVKNKPVLNDSSLAEKFAAKKEVLAQKQAALKETAAKLKQAKKNVQDSVAHIRQEINSLGSGAGLYAFMKRHGIGKDKLTKGQRLLLSVNKIGIGRSWIDYSELTAKNVSLTGVNIELNPAPYYFAAAAGKLNYRFRDFIVKDNKALPNQSLYLLRAGMGQKEKNNLVFTFYNGKKEVLSATTSGSPAYLQRVLGASAETRLALNDNNYIIAEIAKSSYGGISNPQPSQSALIDKAFNFKTRSNEAYSIKLFSQYPQTNTRINAYYRKTGEDFQSFNLYPAGSNQEAWMARVTQSFWKKKLVADATIRKNDFVSPLAAPSFASKNIFKSLQVTLRVPHYPFLSIGYYPSSQLSLSNSNVLTESQYNTLNVIASYSYTIRTTAMNTNAVFTKFYNSSSDSGFIYYNASNWTVNHSILLDKLTLQSSMAITDQSDLYLFTLEQGLQYQCRSWLSLLGGLRHSRLNHAESLIGGTAGLQWNIKEIGTMQLNYDKIYLPGYNRQLLPVDMGRATFYREF